MEEWKTCFVLWRRRQQVSLPLFLAHIQDCVCVCVCVWLHAYDCISMCMSVKNIKTLAVAIYIARLQCKLVYCTLWRLSG